MSGCEQNFGCLLDASPDTIRYVEVFGGCTVPTPIQQQTFPLNFNAERWAIDEVVEWVFLGDFSTAHPADWKECVSYVLKTLRRRGKHMPSRISAGLREEVRKLASYLREIGRSLSDTVEKPPVVWARIAIQYWLSHGGCNTLFVSKFSDWLTEQGKIDVCLAPIGKPQSSPSETPNSPPVATARTSLVEMPVFLLDPCLATNFFRKSVSVRRIEKQTTKPSVGKAADRHEKLQKMLGPNATSCFKAVIEDAVASGSIRNLSKNRDPKTGRYQYTGRHDELCNAIAELYEAEIGQYADTTRERAIRGFVVSRRSWM